LLQSESAAPSTRRLDEETIIRIFQSRVVPEVEAIHGQGAAQTKANAIRIILWLFNMDGSRESQVWGTTLFCNWYQVREWKSNFENALKEFVRNFFALHVAEVDVFLDTK